MIDIALTAILDLFKSLLSDSAKDLLKKKNSEKKAREKIYKLYENLTEVNKATQIFLNELEKLVENTEQGAKHEIILHRKFDRHDPFDCDEENPFVSNENNVLDAMSKLLLAIDEMADSLDTINPQLEIYNYKVVKAIRQYRMNRMGISLKLKDILGINGLKLSYLNIIRNHAINNAEQLEICISELRLFIVSEFDFKDSF